MQILLEINMSTYEDRKFYNALSMFATKIYFLVAVHIMWFDESYSHIGIDQIWSIQMNLDGYLV